MQKILDRAKSLGKMMETTLENERGSAWEELHGKFVPPKQYFVNYDQSNGLALGAQSP